MKYRNVAVHIRTVHLSHPATRPIPFRRHFRDAPSHRQLRQPRLESGATIQFTVDNRVALTTSPKTITISSYKHTPVCITSQSSVISCAETRWRMNLATLPDVKMKPCGFKNISVYIVLVRTPRLCNVARLSSRSLSRVCDENLPQLEPLRPSRS